MGVVVVGYIDRLKTGQMSVKTLATNWHFIRRRDPPPRLLPPHSVYTLSKRRTSVCLLVNIGSDTSGCRKLSAFGLTHFIKVPVNEGAFVASQGHELSADTMFI